MRTQSEAAKLGEVIYRSKISRQHLGEDEFFPNEPDAKQFAKILQARLFEYQKTFKKLQSRNLLKSPFLEIGSEYCLASSLLVNKFGATGIACDISPASLSSAHKFAKKNRFKKLPQMICADANNLPFKSGTFPFVFVYESLHHFPHPKPVLQELLRVLAPQGILLIGAEPIGQEFQIKLWRRPTNLRFWEKLLKVTLLLPFISHIGKTEIEHGILEETFPLETWRLSLSIFANYEAEIKIPFIKVAQSVTDLSQVNPILRLLLAITGGGITAICRKAVSQKDQIASLELICPSCHKKTNEEIVLNGQTSYYECPKCRSKYITKFKIPIILEKKLAMEVLKSTS